MTNYFRPDYTPEWFHLENYDQLADMTRKDIHAIIMSAYTNFNWFSINYLFEKQYTDNWATCWANSDLLERIGDDYINIKGIRSAELSEIEEALKKRKTTLDMSYTDNVQPANDIGHTEIMAVDLACNDDKIIDDLREWLRERRKRGKNRLRDADIKKLINNKIIPCMDLLFWCKSKEIEYTNAQLGDMLFPNATFDRAEKVRKVVRPQAIKYLTTKAYANIL